MLLKRRGLVGLLAMPAVVQAQPVAPGWRPERPLRLVSPFNPGGAIDVLNRLLAERISAELGQPVVVEARPGANTILGAEAVAKAAPDGLTFMITTNSTHTSNPSMYRDLPYDALRSFAPITLLSMGTVLLIAPAGALNGGLPAAAGYRGAQGFSAWARGLGRPVTFGSWGVGSGGHLYGEVLRTMHGLPLEHVPYRGEQPAILDMLAGRLDVTFCSPVGAKPQLEAAKAAWVGMTGPQRSAAMPDVPTFGEQGFAGLDMPIFVAAWAPAGTPPAAVTALRLALLHATEEPAIRANMIGQGQTPVLSTPEALAAIVARDMPRWAELIRISGAKVE